jgi:uncharacterized protein (TIGR02444 family)
MPATDTKTSSVSACWIYVTKIYAKPGVSEACLRLQGRAGVDVSLLLTVMFYTVRCDVELNADDLERLDGLIATWRQEAILPLRQFRRRLKDNSFDIAGTISENLYRQIKKAEIFAEEAEVVMLAQHLERMPCGSRTVDRSTEIIERVVQFYAHRYPGYDFNDATIREAISVLQAAAQ